MSSSVKEEDNELRKKLWTEFGAAALNHYLGVASSYENRIKWSAEAADEMMKQLDKRFGT